MMVVVMMRGRKEGRKGGRKGEKEEGREGGREEGRERDYRRREKAGGISSLPTSHNSDEPRVPCLPKGSWNVPEQL